MTVAPSSTRRRSKSLMWPYRRRHCCLGHQLRGPAPRARPRSGSGRRRRSRRGRAPRRGPARGSRERARPPSGRRRRPRGARSASPTGTPAGSCPPCRRCRCPGAPGAPAPAGAPTARPAAPPAAWRATRSRPGSPPCRPGRRRCPPVASLARRGDGARLDAVESGAVGHRLSVGDCGRVRSPLRPSGRDGRADAVREEQRSSARRGAALRAAAGANRSRHHAGHPRRGAGPSHGHPARVRLPTDVGVGSRAGRQRGGRGHRQRHDLHHARPTDGARRPHRHGSGATGARAV